MPRYFALTAYWQRLPIGPKSGVAAVCVLRARRHRHRRLLPVHHALNPPCMRDGATVVTHHGANGECVGITDGSYRLRPGLRDIERPIRHENRQFVRDHPENYVSVVLLLPISADKGSIMSMTNVVEQVKGAYTAQHYANRNNVEGISPYIQLLIGSDGYQANEWKAAVSAIERASARHIAAVSGLGLSLDGTSNATGAASHDIPVFGATITSDTYDNIKSFVRVSPSNVDDIAAALSYVQADYSRAVLVEDGNRVTATTSHW